MSAARLAVLALALAAAAPAAAAPARPDFSGAWQAQPPFLTPEVLRRAPPPLTPAALAQFQASLDGLFAGEAKDYCGPLKFTGYNSAIGSDLDVISTPGRLTFIADDVSLVRRIFLDPDSLPENLGASTSGFSVGRWEGEELVVETTGLDPTAVYPTPARHGPEIGDGARVVERMRLQDADTLVIEAETTAPAILTAPDRRRWIYRRVAQPIRSVLSFCSKADRSVDPAAGAQRFDDTPPADLPPPPPG